MKEVLKSNEAEALNCNHKMIIHQVAMVIRADDENSRKKIEHICSELNDAERWARNHQDSLEKGDRFDLYYRYEEENINDEC